MKKLIAGVILLGILSSCGNKKTNIDPFASITKEVDSVRQIADSSHHDKSPEDPQPIQADESFDDFIYNFASDDVLQRQRVKFPLPYYNGDKKSNIEELNWKHDDLFTKQHYYTLLFDREEDMDLVGDTSLTSVQVEWMFVKTRMVKRYYFERIKGAWILEAINFASDDVLQRQRVKFPLPYYNGDKKSNIEELNWKHDDLFTKQHYYTLLFDREEDMDLVGDTSLTSVQVEWMFVKTRMVKRYYFERIKGAWILEAINLRPIEQSDNENFVEFFGHFATDSLFQSQRVREPLAFVTSDPDDDFSILETTLDLNQWFAFKPVLPVDRLSNINYGQRNDDDSPTKILALKGIGNGFSNILYFRRKAGEWELYKFEDTSI